MKDLFFTDLVVESVREGTSLIVRARRDEDEGTFIAQPAGEHATARLDCPNQALAVPLAMTGARRALQEFAAARVEVERPSRAIAAALQHAGYLHEGETFYLPLDLAFDLRNVRVVFAGGVESSRRIMTAMVHRGARPVLALGYAASLRGRSGFANLGSLCDDNTIPLLRTADINEPRVVAAVREAAPDYLCVFGWSQIVEHELLRLPRVGCLGLHPTRLPEGRGRAPVPWTLIKGLTESASSLYWLARRVDAGELADQRPFTVRPTDDAASLYETITRVQIEQVEEILPRLAAHTLPRTPQRTPVDPPWPRRKPEDGVIDWRRPAHELYNWVRALTHPYPGAFTMVNGRRLMVWRAEELLDAPPGRSRNGKVVGAQLPAGAAEGALLVACGDGRLLALRRVQWEDGAEQGAHALWAEGAIRTGMRLGS